MARILNQIDYAMRTKAQIEQELAQEKSLMRMMKIDGMGIYNYDRQLKDERAIPLLADFTFDGKQLDEGIVVYLLPAEKNCVIKYTPLTFDQFRINPSETNRILALSPKDKMVYVLSSTDIRKMKISSKMDGSKVVFDLKKHGKLIESAAQVDELIASL
jgi:hypothetical protein